MLLPRRFLSLALAVALASCSGSVAGIPANISAPSSKTTSSFHSGVVLRIRIPRRRRTRVDYLSPATQSIAITVQPSQGGQSRTYNADLTAGSNPNCTSSPLVCTIPLPLAPGRYGASFATFDGLLDKAGLPTGNELSANQSVPITVVIGQENQVNIVLDGVPAAVMIVPSPSAKLFGNQSEGYTLSKCAGTRQTIDVFGLDADGNVILGSGAPKVTLASDNSNELAVSTPAPTAPNAFTLAPPLPPQYPTPNLAVHLTAKVIPAPNAGSTVQTAATSVTFTGDICGVITEFKVPTAGSEPYGIAAGPDGAIWFTENNADKIGRISTGATSSRPQIREFDVPTQGSRPFAITAASDGALWFTECVGNNIGRIPTNGGPVLEFGIPTVNSAPQGITAGSDGALWFTESQGNNIGRIPTNGSPISEYPIPTAQSLPFGGITSGPDGALWFAESQGNKIGTVSTSGLPMTEFPIPITTSFPNAITTGSDGGVWFTQNYINEIGRISVPGGAISEFVVPPTYAGVGGIVSGPDGALWFTYCIGNGIGRMPTNGSPVTGFPIPTSASHPMKMALGPDGAIWFTEYAANKIGRLQ